VLYYALTGKQRRLEPLVDSKNIAENDGKTPSSQMKPDLTPSEVWHDNSTNATLHQIQSEEEKPVLTQKNVERVLNAVREASKVRGAAHVSEVILESKLSETTVRAVLAALQREGKVFSVYRDWWKVV